MIQHAILGLEDTCTGCFACQNICPHHAITLPENREGFYYPVIDKSRCVDCGLCDKICPQLHQSSAYSMQHAYYGFSMSEINRKNSSSGGIFGEIAKIAINEGGVVYGAAFTYGRNIRLDCKSSDEVSLEDIKKSKYVQCHVGDAFNKIKSDLDNGKSVVYSGTPCEVDGLKKYLRKDYKNLLCIDFVCHGVPSMSMLRNYLSYKRFKDVKYIDFRPKNRNWVDDLVVVYGKNKRYVRPWEEDEYYRSFQENIILRRSCFNCRYCNGKRFSDITLADFWYYHQYDKSIYDKRGISLVLINTGKGVDVIEQLRKNGNCFIKEIDLKYARYVYERDRQNPKFHYDIQKRNAFIRNAYEKGFSYAFKNSGLRKNLLERAKSFVKRFLRKFRQ